MACEENPLEPVTPPILTAVRELRWQLLSGKAARDAVREYLAAHNDGFSRKIRELLLLREQNTLGDRPTGLTNPYHVAFWDLLQRGLDGHPILEPLSGLETEVDRAARMDLAAHIAELPFKALLPLMFFQFPAFLFLLVVPLLRDLRL